MPENSGRPRGRPRKFDREQALRKALEIFWQQGFEPTTTAELCSAMGLAPPSMYCTFGNKAQLFLEAVRLYEEDYWAKPAADFMGEPDIYKAVAQFFEEAAKILLNPSSPCGCMVVLAAVNISKEEKEIIAAINELRMATRTMFADKLRLALNEGQIPADTNVPALAGALTTFLEGLSLQSRDGLFQCELVAIASLAVRMLPLATAKK